MLFRSPPCDAHAMLLSLPRRCGTELATIPASVPYLRAEAGRVQLPPARPGRPLRVGFAWAGNPANGADRLRSMRLADWQPLLRDSGATFYSLQVGPRAAELQSLPADLPVVDLSAQLRDFADTASALATAKPTTPAPTTTVVRADPATIAKVVAAGSGVGLLTGFFGVGGGFVIVPALVLALGFTMPEAVGTSLLVITINSVVALTTRLQSGNIEWGTIIPFTVASLIGVVIGGRLAGARNSSTLQMWFVGLLFAVAAYTAVTSALAIW